MIALHFLGPTVTKMKWVSFVVSFSILQFTKCVTITEFQEWAENVQSSSHVCNTPIGSKPTVTIFEVVNCDEPNAISAYDFKVTNEHF